MLFPLNIIVAALIAIIHTVICFSLKISDTYKTKFRIYSVVSNLIFIALVSGFSLFSRISAPNAGIGTYFVGLVTVYVLLTLPLLVALIVLIKSWVIKLDSFSIITRYIVILTISLLLICLSFIGYYPFMLFFYGFAP